MDFGEFAELLISHMELPYTGPFERSTGVYDELGVDSLQAFQMLIIIETAAELDVPSLELPDIITLGDAYDYYLAARAASAGTP
jgi:acyl carrier protein